MKKAWIIGLLTLLCSTMSHAENIVVKQVIVKDFFQLRVDDNFDVIYKQNTDSAGVVIVMAAQGDMEKIVCESKKGRLTIDYKGLYDKEQMQGSLVVYSTALEEVENYGIGSVEVASSLSGIKFKAKVMGNGSITASKINYGIVNASVVAGNGTIRLGGSCRETELKVVGAGQVEADDLKSQEVSCRISGNGTIGCHATKNLEAWVTGRGEVYYRGTPAIKKSSLGELVLRSLEGE